VEVELTKDYRFEAAHFLPRVPAGHKCARVHGHSYKAEIEVRGPVDPATGWLIDFGVIDEAWGELFKLFDHHNLAMYVWRALRPRIPALSAVTIWETSDSKCTYRGT